MTEEEIEKKSEENWDKCILRDIKEPEHWAIHEHHVQAYIDGYTQCATDINVVTTHTDNTEVILNLQKENEELKKKVFVQEEIIIGEQKENKELKAQIEKMKCCGNCKKIFICKKSDKSGMGSYPYNCKDWELAE